jgi:hypothetical protein
LHCYYHYCHYKHYYREYEDKNNAHKAKCKAVRATRDAEYTAAMKRAQEAKKLAEAEENRKRGEYFTLHPERPWHEQVGKSLIDTWTKLIQDESSSQSRCSLLL